MKWNPEDYPRNSDAQLKWAQELRQNLNLQGNESVLDVGSGCHLLGRVPANVKFELVQELADGSNLSLDLPRRQVQKERLQADSRAWEASTLLNTRGSSTSTV